MKNSLTINSEISSQIKEISYSPGTISAWWLVMKIRLSVWCGKVVVIEGAPGTGKTILAKAITNDRVISFAYQALRTNHFQQFKINENEIPRVIFAIDEPQIIERGSLQKIVKIMKARKRGFVFVTQLYGQYSDLLRDEKVVRYKLLKKSKSNE